MGDRAVDAKERTAVRRWVRAAAMALMALMALALIVILAEPAWAKIVVVDRDRAHGDYAVALASGMVDRPTRLWVRVESSPKKDVRVTWSTSCTKNSVTRPKSGEFTARTPLERAVRMGYRRPDECTFTARGSLGVKGRILVILLARVPG